MGHKPTTSLDEALPCPVCGYDLRATTEDRCSECGRPFDRSTLRRSEFPWERRKELGRVRTWLGTIWLVTLGSRRLAFEESKRQDVRGARVFARSVAAIVVTMLLAAFGAVVWQQEGLAFLAVQKDISIIAAAQRWWTHDCLVPWSAGATLLGVLPVCLTAFGIGLAYAPAMVVRVRRPMRMAHRSAAIGCYAAGPLIWLVPLVASTILHFMLLANEDIPWQLRFPVVGVLDLGWVCTFIGTLPLTLLRTGQWARRVRHGGAGAAWGAAANVLGLWLAAAVLWLGVTPWAVGFLWIVIDGFRP